MYREAWRAAVHGVTKNRTRLSNWTELKYLHVRIAIGSGKGGSKRTLFCGSPFLVRAQRTIWGLTYGKNKFIKVKTERTTEGRGGPRKEGHWHQNVEVRTWKDKCVFSVAQSDFLRPRGLQTARLLYPSNCPGKNTRVGFPFLLQGIFPT